MKKHLLGQLVPHGSGSARAFGICVANKSQKSFAGDEILWIHSCKQAKANKTSESEPAVTFDGVRSMEVVGVPLSHPLTGWD